MRALALCLAAALLPFATAGAQTGEVVPNENLVVQGIPKIPAAVAASVRPYTESRSATFSSWHPHRREMLITTRFGETPQVHLVRTPGGARRQLTFFPERAISPGFPPAGGGDFFVFTQDIGGGEFFQNYRYDLSTGRVTLLTDGKSRNGSVVWSRSGDRIAYASTRRNGNDTDLYAENPADPNSDRLVAELSGGGWQPLDWSPDGRRILVVEGISVNEYLPLADRRGDGAEDAADAARRKDPRRLRRRAILSGRQVDRGDDRRGLGIPAPHAARPRVGAVGAPDVGDVLERRQLRPVARRASAWRSSRTRTVRA